MAGASTGTDDRRLTLGEGCEPAHGLETKAINARGIGPFQLQTISVRLPDGRVNPEWSDFDDPMRSRDDACQCRETAGLED
jgi:hypothetical protein